MALSVTYNDNPDVGLSGELASGRDHEPLGRLCDGAVRPGQFVIASGENLCSHPSAVAADVDALVLSSTALGDASGTSYGVADLDGANTTGVINPARPITVTAASDADWGDGAATSVTLDYLNAAGEYVSETIAIADGGNETVSSTQPASQFIKATFPAQAGDATGSIGLGAKVGSLKALGVVKLDKSKKIDFTAYADGETCTVIAKGEMFVEVEASSTPVAGGQVFCRVVTAGAEELGAVTATPDGTSAAPDCAPVPGCVFTSTKDSNNIARIAFDLEGNG